MQFGNIDFQYFINFAIFSLCVQALGMVFSAANEDSSLMLLPHLDQMLAGLHAQVSLRYFLRQIEVVFVFVFS